MSGGRAPVVSGGRAPVVSDGRAPVVSGGKGANHETLASGEFCILWSGSVALPMPQLAPDIVYLGLILGLWLGVTVTIVPGTGLLELLALAGISGSLLLLTGMPVNWIGVLVLVAGASAFALLPYLLRPRHAVLTVVGLALQVLGGLLMFPENTISPLILGLSAALSLLYWRFALLPVLRRVRKAPPPAALDDFLGEAGRVVRALDPVGTVQLRGELWSATSEHPLAAGEEVIVVGRAGLNLRVAERAPAPPAEGSKTLAE